MASRFGSSNSFCHSVSGLITLRVVWHASAQWRWRGVALVLAAGWRASRSQVGRHRYASDDGPGLVAPGWRASGGAPGVHREGPPPQPPARAPRRASAIGPTRARPHASVIQAETEWQKELGSLTQTVDAI